MIDVLLTTVLWMTQATTPQAPPVPQVDLAVDVIANVPLHTKLTAYTRLLAKRQQTPSFNRRYPPITLEVIRLVNRNPRKPAGKQWDSIGAVNLGYDPATKEVVVEYCIDFCASDPRTGALDPKRKMVSYRALEPTVIARLNQQLEQLKKIREVAGIVWDQPPWRSALPLPRPPESPRRRFAISCRTSYPARRSCKLSA